MYKVSISPIAESDIWAHAVFVANVNPLAAENLIDEIYNEVFKLERDALLFPEFYNGYRKLTVHNRYAVFYKVIENEVNVDRVFDMRTNEYQNIVIG